MKLFSATQMSWNEPYFFLIKLREPWGWGRRAILGLVIFLVMFLAIHFTGRQRMGTAQAVLLSLACGAVLVALLDVGNIQREVTITEDSIGYQSSVQMGIYWMGSIALKDIQHVNLMRPEDWNRPWGAMLVQTAADGFLLGVPNKVSLETAANVLHRLGVAVTLKGWEPSETDTRVQVKDEVVLPQETRQFAGTAKIWAVDESEGRLSPPAATAVAVAMALGPLFLSLLALVAAGIYIVVKWSALPWLDKLMLAGIPFAAVIASFVYLIQAGQFLASRYLISVGKAVLRTRPSARFSGGEDELICVEVFDRTAWTSTVSKSIDFGFMQLDPSTRLLKFEGNKNRWDIPLSALTACRIEEAHVGSEGNENAEKRYYVVIACEHAGQPWEAGLIQTRTALGNDGKDQRYARAQGLLQRFSALITPA